MVELAKALWLEALYVRCVTRPVLPGCSVIHRFLSRGEYLDIIRFSGEVEEQMRSGRVE